MSEKRTPFDVLCAAADRRGDEIAELKAALARAEAERAHAQQNANKDLCLLADTLREAYAQRDSERARAEKAEAKLSALREQTRVRDARVEKPKPGDLVLLWDGYSWEADRLEAGLGFWRDSGREVDSYPYWLPMPPKPEETR